MGFSDSNIFSKIALIVLPVGELFIIIGMATSFWYAGTRRFSGKAFSYGLWKACEEGLCTEHITLPDWWDSTRAFVILGMLCAAAGIVLFVISMLKSDIRALKIAAIFLPFVTGMCIFIGIGVFAGKYLDENDQGNRENLKLSWSFGLTTVGGVISVIAGILWIIGIMMDRK